MKKQDKSMQQAAPKKLTADEFVDDILQKKSKRPIKALEGIAAACQ